MPLSDEMHKSHFRFLLNRQEAQAQVRRANNELARLHDEKQAYGELLHGSKKQLKRVKQHTDEIQEDMKVLRYEKGSLHDLVQKVTDEIVLDDTI